MPDNSEVNEDGIHTGVTGPPVDYNKSITGRHEEVTTSPTVVIPVSEPAVIDNDDNDKEDGQVPSDQSEEALRNRITAAENRALKTEDVNPDEDKPKAATRAKNTPGTQR